ncbi:MAG: tyrosine-type recombinase/integrase [bacterium]
MGGSIIKDRRDNKWCISVYWEGKRYRIYRHPITREPFYSKQSAQKQLDKIRCEVDEGSFNPKSWLPDSPISMRIYCQEWLKTLDVSKKTLTGYKTAVNKYIVPFFGSKDIRNIRYNDIVKFKNLLPLEDKGKYNIIGVLKKILQDAWRNEDITHVPPFPKLSYNHPEIEYLTLDQQENILKAIPTRHRPIFQFMMEYGVRPQEARALQRDSIKDGKIIIRRVFSDNTLREGTKTGSKGVRIFEITAYMREVFISMSERKIESPFVFIREDGKPYTSKNLNAIWHEAEEKAGIRCKLYNAVRHSLGCQLLDQGEDMDLVREILGHTKAEMTRRYAKRKVTKSTEALSRRRKKIIKFKAKDES